jgi:hypothetical protein
VTLGGTLPLTAGTANPKLTITDGGVLEGTVSITGTTPGNKITLTKAVLTGTGATGIALDSANEGSVTLTWASDTGPTLKAESIKVEATTAKSIELTKATISAGGHADSTAAIAIPSSVPTISLSVQGNTNGATLELESGGKIVTVGTDTLIKIGAEANTALTIGGAPGTWTYTGVGGDTPTLKLWADTVAASAEITGTGTTSNMLAGTAGTPNISVGAGATVTGGLKIGKYTTIDLTTFGTVALGNASKLVLTASSTNNDNGVYPDVGKLVLGATNYVTGVGSAIGSALTPAAFGSAAIGDSGTGTETDIYGVLDSGSATAGNAAKATQANGTITITARANAAGNTISKASKLYKTSS